MFAGSKVWQSPILLASALMAAGSLSILSAQMSAQPASNSSAQTARLAERYGNLPLSFEANHGQTDARVKFMSRGSGYGIYLTSDEAVLALNRDKCAGQQVSEAKPSGSVHGQAGCAQDKTVVTMRLAGNANATANPAGEERLPGTANYFVGGHQAAWRVGVPTYSRVRYSSVYHGVDLVYYGNQRQLEYDFAVAPNADPNAIRLQFSGVKKLKIDSDGDLILSAANGDIAFHKPVVYQEQKGHRDLVAGRFTLGKRHTVGFALNAYDRSKPLIIDPVLAYSTYVGGSGSDGDTALAIAVDSSGDAYITGQTDSGDFPLTSNAFQSSDEATASSAYNAFVTKLNAAGTALVYSTYLGGSGNTVAVGIAVDSSGDAYVTGHTFAGNFPVTSGAFQTTSAASSTEYAAFITKLNPAGTSLVYSTFLGGSGNGSGTGDTTNGIAVDSSGNAYVAGLAYSANFPVTTGAFQATNAAAANAISGGFVTKLNAAGSALVYSTFLSGSGSGHDGVGDAVYAIAVDTSGDAYVTGSTGSSNFPITAGAYLTTNPAAAKTQTAAFVTKLNPAGTALLFSTYLGGSENASGNAIAVNASGDAYVAGYAMYTDFPVTAAAYQTANNASSESTTNAFVTELNATGTGLVYSTWLGGSGAAVNAYVHSGDSADAIAVDAAGDAYVTGTAFSSNFPVTSGAVQPTNEAAGANASNAFVTELNPNGTALVYSSYLGGSGYAYGTRGYYHGDFAMGLALDSSNNVYVAGAAYSVNFPVSNSAFQTGNNAAGTSGSNAFVAKVTIATLVATTTTLGSSANSATSGSSVTFTAYVDAASGSTSPAGIVTFKVDGSTASTAALSAAGTATYTTSSLAAGTHSITASYGGSASFSASTSNTFTQTINAPAPAVLKSPAPASSLSGASAMFTWTAGTGATSYDIWFGTTGVGSNNLWGSGSTSATSVTFGGLPTNGATIYVRLFTNLNGTMVHNDYTYTAMAQAVLTSPAPGTALSGPSATFSWTRGSQATSYTLWLGTTGVGSNNLWGSGATTATSVTFGGLPTNGATIYVRLFTNLNGTMLHNDYTYTAASQAALTSPTSGAAFTGRSATFKWSAATGATSYDLWLGSTGVGSNNLWGSGATTVTSLTFGALPTNGETVYVRLFTNFNGVMTHYDYTYTAAN